MALNISVPQTPEKKEIYLGENIPEFISLFRKHMDHSHFDMIFSKKNELFCWLSENCEKEMLEDAWQFFDASPAQFILALNYMHKEKTTKKLSLKDFAGYAELKEYITQYLIPFVSSDHKFRKTFNVQAQEGVLFYGPPGCGKSYLSKCIADEMGYCFLDPSPALFHSYQGLRTIPNLFAISRKLEKAALYFDDLDKLCQSRESISERITSLFLSQIDGYNEGDYLLMGSTNYPEKIDAAFYRPGRFGQVRYIGLPSLDTRIELFKFYLKGVPTDSLDFKELGEKSEYCSCADIKHYCKMAAFEACQESIRKDRLQEVGQQALLAHFKRINPSGMHWLDQKLSVNFGPFAEVFPELLSDLEKYQEKKRSFDVR